MTVASLVIGDTNQSFDEVKALAERCGGTAVRGHGPDHAIVIGADVVDVHVLGKYGSDAHHAILFELAVDGVTVTALLWNVWVGQKPRRVRRTLRRLSRRHRPDVIVLNEAYRCGDVLRTVKRYDVHQGPNVGEGADVAVLVAHRHRTLRSRALRMRQTWTVVSKGRVKPGREFRADRIRLAGGPVLRVLGWHGPTDHPINADAAAEAHDRIVRWAQPRTKEHR
ncbi:hypothetical protein [Nocardioides sp. SR21]|uniref:hypothetical protein n=1 Tax=Nocardioides sp. SR21 TaxID=2919501 RepID=UPI001FAA23EF|nr:hypothetical protein [Nocardioides sp. SR21]